VRRAVVWLAVVVAPSACTDGSAPPAPRAPDPPTAPSAPATPKAPASPDPPATPKTKRDPCDPLPEAGDPCDGKIAYCVIDWGDPGGWSSALWCRNGHWELENEANL
jgi:hypothetical protein